jgi:hypothetical protein
MNEIYSMSIVTHNYGVIGILGIILVNIIMLMKAKDIKIYTRYARIFMPFGILMIVSVMFTGVVMMAAKHLSFSVENIVMIILSIVLIVLENKRTKKLYRLDRTQENAFSLYKVKAYKIFLIEVIMIMLVSSWIWF